MRKVLSLSLLAVMVLLASCSDSNDYRNIVPQNAKVIMRIDGKAFYSQTGINRDKLIGDIIEASGNEEDLNKIADLGIDCDAPVYGFVGDNVLSCGSAGLLAKVSDRSKFEERMAEGELEKEDIDGVSVYSSNHMRDVVIGVSDEAVLVLGPAYDDQKKLKKQLVAMLNRENADNNPSDNELFKRAEKADAILSLYADLSVVPDAAWNFVRRIMTEGGQADVLNVEELQTFTYGLDVTASDHILNTNLWWLSSDEQVQEKYNAQLQCMRKVDNTALGLFTARTVLGMAMNFDGDAMLAANKKAIDDVLAQSGEAGEYVAIMFELMKQVDGNMLFGVDDFETFDGGLAIVTTGDEDAITECLTNVGLPKPATRDGKLVFNLGDELPFRLSLDDKLFVATMQQDAEARINGNSNLASPMLDQIKDNKFTFFLNLQRGMEIAEESGALRGQIREIVDAFAEFFDNVHFVSITY
ncbi:MAG: DUF4836 family protein [Bacteroidaceae bacterium]|nr:DUF4836 family protein [Bacteroidaceae bacterium]